jgi:hypothetical protein
MTDAWASDVALDETHGAPAPVEAGAHLQSGAIVGIFVLLMLYFLYFASPILIPIIMALLLSMLLAPFVRLLEWISGSARRSIFRPCAGCKHQCR